MIAIFGPTDDLQGCLDFLRPGLVLRIDLELERQQVR